MPTVACPHCSTSLEVPPHGTGAVRCSSCRGRFRVAGAALWEDLPLDGPVTLPKAPRWPFVVAGAVVFGISLLLLWHTFAGWAEGRHRLVNAPPWKPPPSSWPPPSCS
jgi:hypothetical protein